MSTRLQRDSSGNLYGTTSGGGASGFGTVFEVTASGAESVLYSFEGDPVDGQEPFLGGLLLDTSGNLHGVTEGGGVKGVGTVFKLTAGGTESVLLNFNSTAGGRVPYGGLTRDAAGNLYGTTPFWGTGAGCSGTGVW